MKSKDMVSDPQELRKVRAGAAVLLSLAVQQLFPKAIVLGVRATDIGFACDCLLPELMDPALLPMIERQMIALIHADLPIVVSEMMAANVCEYLRYHGQPERASLLNSDTPLVEVVRIGDYLEVIPGPHVASLREIGALKLLTVDTSEEVLSEAFSYPITTLTGCAFSNRRDLKQFLKLVDHAAECDHRRLGRELGLYDLYGPGGVSSYLWSSRGQVIRNQLLKWWEGELFAQGIERIHTPTLLQGQVPSTRVPLHAALFARGLHSYRELPLRYAECAPLLRPAKTHELAGLFRQGSFYGDETTLFCRADQLGEELISSLQFINRTIRVLGLRSKGYLYTRGSSYRGTVAQWDQATKALKEALAGVDLPPIEEVSRDGLPGPKVEFRFLDALEREWAGPTVGLDFALPEQQGLRYQSKQDEMVLPLMVVRSAFGSLERTVGLLIERFAGALPLWLAPEQVRLLPVGEQPLVYAKAVGEQCRTAGIRVGIDERNERLAAKVFAAEAAKIPFIAIVGDKEAREGVVTVRTRQQHQQGGSLAIEAFVTLVKTSER